MTSRWPFIVRNSTRMSPTLASKLAGAEGGAQGGGEVPGSSAPSSWPAAPRRGAKPLSGHWEGVGRSRSSPRTPGGVAEGQPGSQSMRRGAASGEEATTEKRPERRGALEPGGAEGSGGGSRGGSTAGPGENPWGSQEEEGEGRAAVEGPGSSEERNKVVEDWESKVLGSESAKEERRKGHSGIFFVNRMPSSMRGTKERS